MGKAPMADGPSAAPGTIHDNHAPVAPTPLNRPERLRTSGGRERARSFALEPGLCGHLGPALLVIAQVDRQFGQ